MCIAETEPHGFVNETRKLEGGGDIYDDGNECAVCLSRAPDCELRPCGHARFCRSCIVETVCSWAQEGPPRCAFCRAPFHAMIFFK